MYLLTIVVLLNVFIFNNAEEFEDPLSEYIHVPARYIAPIPANSILKDNTSPEKMSVNLCASKCTLLFRSGNFPCYAFEFTPGSNMCVYTNITTLVLNAGFLSLKENNAVHYYERPKGSFKNLFHEMEHTALQDQKNYYDIKMNLTVDQCAHLCLLSSETGCMSFSYSTKLTACGLSNKYHSNSGTSTAAVITTPLYSHYQYFTSWPCNAIIHKNYSPKAIASVRFPYQAVRNIECFLKLEAPTGHKIEISFSTIYFGGSVCNNNGEGIMVYDGDSAASQVIGGFCQRIEGRQNIKSRSNSIFVTYKTGSTPMAFKAVYQFEDLCSESNCKNGATCEATNTSYVCRCPRGWSGRFCEANIDDCISDPCLFNGKCIDELNGYKCQCPNEFTGQRCEVFLGKCAEKPCVHGTCHVTSAFNYTCRCEKDYIGRNCDHKQLFCNPDPCTHGTCQETFGYYICHCNSGFVGKNCDTPLDLCLDRPCVHGVCSTINGTYHCACPPGFTGHNCEKVFDFCSGVNCNHGKCVMKNNTYKCECKEGWTGDTCEIDKLFDPCENAHCGKGLCEALHDNRMSYHCVCPVGFEGRHCETRVIRNNGKLTVSNDICHNVSCANSGLCQEVGGRAMCICKAPYVGEFCDIRLSDCEFHPCHRNATCVDTMTSHVCMCPDGMTGLACDQKTSPCLSNPCKQGICQVNNSTYGYRCILYTVTGHGNVTFSRNDTLLPVDRK